jgi:hypothetical protein
VRFALFGIAVAGVITAFVYAGSSVAPPIPFWVERGETRPRIAPPKTASRVLRHDSEFRRKSGETRGLPNAPHAPTRRSLRWRSLFGMGGSDFDPARTDP